MKKIYSKPEAELISFYSNEKITADEDLSGNTGLGDADSGWT